jgi:hypothetical protein
LQAVVKIKGYVKLVQLLDSKVLPYVLEEFEDGEAKYFTIEEDGEIGIRSESWVSEVFRL